MTGGARLVYDVWGGTVTVAHEIARRADHGEILVTETTRRLLPETIEVEHTTGSDDKSVWSVEPATVNGPA
jgi:class 3 adenylate cyclase